MNYTYNFEKSYTGDPKCFVFNKRNLIKYYQSLMYDMHAT